jgi:hypothetical protein
MISPGLDTVPPGQDKHDETSSASTAKEYMFTGHGKHGTAPTSFLYEPGAHDRQSLRPVPPKPALHGQLLLLSYKICTPVAIARNSTSMSASDAAV